MKKLAPLLILIAGMLWGSMGIFVHVLGNVDLGSMEIVEIRGIGTALFMALVLLIYDRKLFRIRLKDIWCFLGTGLVSITFFNFCYFNAIQLSSMAVAAVLLYTAPAFVMIMSYFLFRESLGKVKIFSLLMTIAGCALVTGLIGSGASISPRALLYGLGAGLGYAFYSIFSRYALQRGYHILTIIFYTFLVSGICTVPLCNMGKLVAVSTSSIGMLGFCILFGTVCTVCPYLAYTTGLKYVENGKASIIASIEPVAAAVYGLILYGETLSIMTLLGMALVLGAIVMNTRE